MKQVIEDQKFFEQFGRVSFQRDLLAIENQQLKQQIIELQKENKKE